ncbi:MAG TPA: hypothetical protein VJ725_26660 [Thermoanaerobaculia bacterium]|nr:hypothetical protein [Thermoanaerobaculia bacterium]
MATNRERITETAESPEERVVELTPSEAEKKVTCPFLGSVVASGDLLVRSDPGNPLARIQDVVELGNGEKGDLGRVLGFFAHGNHGKRRGSPGRLDADVPPGLFSLELPGSQGAHAGHSGILMGDPAQPDSGRFSKEAFKHLEDLSDHGFIRRSAIARFIAQNVARDPRSELFPLETWIEEVADFSKSVIPSLRDGIQDSPADAELHQSVTRITGGNHLLASAGEFGLLLAFLHNSPRTRHDRDPAFLKEEIAAMFRDKKLPPDWEEWEKTSRDWIRHTLVLATRAAAVFGKNKFKRRIMEIGFFDGLFD